MNDLFGMSGIVWTQLIADIINVIISYIIYGRLVKEPAYCLTVDHYSGDAYAGFVRYR